MSEFENKNLGQIREVRTGQIWNAVQIHPECVRLWKGVNDSVFLSLQFFKDSISEGRFLEVKE
jgi:hypothetical protein